MTARWILMPPERAGQPCECQTGQAPCGNYAVPGQDRCVICAAICAVLDRGEDPFDAGHGWTRAGDPEDPAAVAARALAAAEVAGLVAAGLCPEPPAGPVARWWRDWRRGAAQDAALCRFWWAHRRHRGLISPGERALWCAACDEGIVA